jgi:hypothetical protein
VTEVTGQGAPGDRTPESLLQFLSDHRQSTDRRRERGRRLGERRRANGRRTGAVVALVLVGACALVWGSFTHFRFTSRVPAGANAATHGSAPREGGGGTPQAKATVGKTDTTVRTAARREELWHRGLHAWPAAARHGVPDIYYEWLRSNFSCAAYASYGCWKVKVVTRRGCPHGFDVLVDETQGGANVGLVSAFVAGLRPEEPKFVEVDADRANVDGHVGAMSCN